MGFRFLHLADLHLETSFGGRPATRERLRAATREAFAKAVDLAIRERLHAVLVAGDLFDDPLLSVRSEAWLVQQARRLAEAGVWLLAACGNHDPGGEHFRAAGLGLARGAEAWRSRVHLFLGPEPATVEVTDASGAPVGIVVGAGHPTEREAANLAARFPRLDARLPVVGLLHTQIDTAAGAEGHDRYAPSTRADYERLGYAYFALGHVHQRGQPFPGLPAFYAGNLQGRNARETGPKGGLVAEAHAGAAAAEPRFVRLAPVRWARVRVETLPAEVSAAAFVDALGRRIAQERESAHEEMAITVEVAGETPLARRLRSEQERSEVEDDLAAGTGALEVRLRDAGLALPLDRSLLRESPSVFAEALALLESAASDDRLLLSLAPEPLARALPDEDARLAHLRALLSGLPDELALRFLPEPGPAGRP
jgi:DNA repair exonuclease SbcCD nuclease subunit